LKINISFNQWSGPTSSLFFVKKIDEKVGTMRQIKNNASREFDPSLLGTDRGRHSLKKDKKTKTKANLYHTDGSGSSAKNRTLSLHIAKQRCHTHSDRLIN
jgi:hypothetical protein